IIPLLDIYAAYRVTWIIVCKITQSTPKAIEKIYDEKIRNEDLEVIRFEPHAIYSLDPRQEAGRLLAIDKDKETTSKLGE
ncbi:hypothetical protein LCGC14_2944600, partial [marine sediment metagenome]